MKFKVEFNPEFADDLFEAVSWYNEQQAGLENRFFKQVKKQSTDLALSALHFAIRYDDVRCVKIKNFPYLLHYHVNELKRCCKS